MTAVFARLKVCVGKGTRVPCNLNHLNILSAPKHDEFPSTNKTNRPFTAVKLSTNEAESVTEKRFFLFSTVATITIVWETQRKRLTWKPMCH